MNYELQTLERRRLLSVSVDGNLITVTGTRGDDRISVQVRCTYPSDIGVTQDLLLVVINGRKRTIRQALDVTVSGGGGDDVIKSEWCPSRSLTLRGGSGDDRIRVGSGWATVRGGLGNDVIRMIDSPVGDAEYGNLSGGPGDDTIVGGPGNETLSGAAGNDLLLGGGGNDRLTGGIGNDRFFGGEGDDVLFVSTDELARGGKGRDSIKP